MAQLHKISRSAIASSRRTFSTSSSSRASILFALGALSNSRETQHFNKLSRLQRVEHSPPLKLIKTSEIDPFPLPTPPKPVAPSVGKLRSSTRIWDKRALQAGRVILTDNARSVSRMRKALDRARRREAKRALLMKQELDAWMKERQKMRREMRAAGVWILLSVGTATALAMWRFWPQRGVVDSGEMGRKIAERARNAMPLPSVSKRVSAAVASPPVGVTGSVAPSSSTPANVQSEVMENSGKRSEKSWWKEFFWKQQ